MPKVSNLQKTIVTEISNEIKKNGITSLTFNEKISAEKTIISVFEFHNDAVPNCLTKLIAEISQADAIAIEQAVEHTAFLEHFRTLAASNNNKPVVNNRYITSLIKLTKLVNCPLICIDAPEKIRANKHKKKDQDIDALRNSYMAQILTYFAPGKTIITINGIAHYADLFAQLGRLDNKTRKISIFYFVDPAVAQATVIIDQKDSTSFKIVTPNEEALKSAGFHALIKQALTPFFPSPLLKFTPNTVFFSSGTDEKAHYPFKHATSKDAMLPLESESKSTSPMSLSK